MTVIKKETLSFWINNSWKQRMCVYAHSKYFRLNNHVVHTSFAVGLKVIYKILANTLNMDTRP